VRMQMCLAKCVITSMADAEISMILQFCEKSSNEATLLIRQCSSNHIGAILDQQLVSNHTKKSL